VKCRHGKLQDAQRSNVAAWHPPPAIVRGNRQRRQVEFAAVSASPSVINSRIRWSNLPRSPATLKQMPFSWSFYDFRSSAQEEVHQDGDFVVGAAPVFTRERKQREVGDAALDAGADDAAHGFDAAPMPRNPGQASLPRPTPIAVHDDGDVTRNVAAFGYFAGG
jgi:hypothetical protein